MVYVMSISLLLCLVVIIPSLPCQKASKPFWRRRNNQTKPTLLPSIKKDPEFYRSKLIFSHFNTIYPAVLTLFVPGFFVVKYPGGVLIGRTPQKFCKIVVMVLFFLFLINFMILLSKKRKKIYCTSKLLPFCSIECHHPPKMV